MVKEGLLEEVAFEWRTAESRGRQATCYLLAASPSHPSPPCPAPEGVKGRYPVPGEDPSVPICGHHALHMPGAVSEASASSQSCLMAQEIEESSTTTMISRAHPVHQAQF